VYDKSVSMILNLFDSTRRDRNIQASHWLKSRHGFDGTAMNTPRSHGVLAPVVTPFSPDLRPDSTRLVAHCRWLLDNDVGLAVFGTNSEANSLTVPEKLALLDALVEAGIPPDRMMPGTGCCAFPDTVELTRRAVQH